MVKIISAYNSNQTQSRLVIYVNNTLCLVNHGKNKLGTLSRMAQTSPHIVSTMISSDFKIVVLEQINLPTRYMEFHEKSFVFNYRHGGTFS